MASGAFLHIVSPDPSPAQTTKVNGGFPASGTCAGVPSVRGFLDDIEGTQTCCSNGVWTVQFNNIVNGTYTLHVLSTVSGGPSDSRTVAFTGFGSPGDPGPYVRPLRSENAFVSVDAEPETSIPMDENGNVKVQGTYDVNTVTGLKISFLRENTEPKEGRITLFEGGDWKGRFTEMTARDGYTLQVIPDDAGTEPLSVAPLGIAEPE